MIPLLFERNATLFNNAGLGSLPSWVEGSVEVVEERNGEFYLQGELPVGALHVDQLAIDRIILAAPAPGKPAQPFRIRQLSKPEDRDVVAVVAHHVSYQLCENILKPFSVQFASAQQSLNWLTGGGHMVPQINETPFHFESNIVLPEPVLVSIDDPKSVRAFFGGSEGSMVDLYGGELEWDGWTVRLLESRGADSGKVIRYGQNLETLSYGTDSEGLVTGYYGWWRNSDGLYFTDATVFTDNVGDFAYPRVVPVDLSNDITLAEGQLYPTDAQIESALRDYVSKQDANQLSVSVTVTAGALDDLQDVSLCDTVTVLHPGYDLMQKAKIVRTVFDPINEQYKEITIGEILKSITDTIAGLLGG